MFRILLAAGAVLVLAAPGTAAEKYEIDPGHVQINLTAQHFGLIQLGGFFGDVTGTVMYDEDPAVCSFEVRIGTDSFVASHPARQDAVKSEFFLDTENHPEITFVSKKLAAADDGHHLTGDLTIRGSTHEVTFPVMLHGPRPDPFGNSRMGIEGSLVVNRQDYGIAFDRKMPDDTPFVGNDVTITILVEATRPTEE